MLHPLRKSLRIPQSRAFPMSAGKSRAEVRRARGILIVSALLTLGRSIFLEAPLEAHNIIGTPSNSGAASSSSQGTTTAGITSQAASAATTAAAQAAQAAITARRAQESLVQALAHFNTLEAAQTSAAAQAALGTSNVPNGLGPGGLNPSNWSSTPAASSGIQLVDLGAAGKNQISLSNGGTIALPKGTAGTDQVAITGAGSVTTTGGAISASAGSLTTTTGGTLAATSGGSISLTAGSGTITATTATTIESSLAGTVTLPANGGTISVPANQAITVPAGSSVSFSGTGTGTVTISGAGTVALSGAGTLALANAASGSGGLITTSSGTATFTNGAVSSLTAGSTIDFSGSGTVAFDGSGSDNLPVIIEPNVTPAAGSATTPTLTLPAFTTTGTLLSTTGYNLPTSGWTGVEALSQSQSPNGPTVVTVTQDQQQALLSWSSFNIGQNTVLDFDQSAGGVNVGDWVAINTISASMSPSQILGRLTASGQVYVINQNGIIFGGSSQVDVHALTASSLPINMNLVNDGVLLGGATTDDQFLFSQGTIPESTGESNPVPEFDPPAAPSSGDGEVVVQPGAVLESPTTPENVGGRIALIAPVVDNEGTIATPDGQTILAAGLQVGFTAHAETDPSLRGLDTFVGMVDDSTTNGIADGTVINGGLIEIPRADLTMAGKDVEQNGIIDSLTSVSLNGRVDLLADYGAVPFLTSEDGVTEGAYIPGATGTVEFGANSVTQILPDTTGATIVGPTLALPSIINVEGQTIDMDAGAELLAPGALATSNSVDLAELPLTAGVNFSAGEWLTGGADATFALTNGQINIAEGAVIDVSGSQNVAAAVTEDIVQAELRGTELANSPLQQDGPLRGETIEVNLLNSGVYDGDAWIGSPIGDLSGYAGLVAHTVNELTANGGTVNLQAGGSVNLAPGSTINVSGGWINYQGAYVQTTQVVTADGEVIPISQATPDQIYEGIYNGFTESSSKWGVSQTYTSALINGTTYQPGFIQGGNGGAITITAPMMTLQGSLSGNTVAGANQVTPTAPIIIAGSSTSVTGLPQFAGATFTGSNFLPVLDPILGVPISSSLVLNLIPAPAGSGQTNPEDVVFQSSSGPAVSDPFASSGNPVLNLSADLVGVDGFSNLVIDGSAANGLNAAKPATGTGIEGNIALPAGVNLTTLAAGSITMESSNIDIEGSILAPAGTLTLVAQNVDDSQVGNINAPPAPLSNRGQFTLGSAASLSTVGLIVDLAGDSSYSDPLPQDIKGGVITIKSYDANFEAGSSVNASGGVLVSGAGKISYGTGGSIDIEAGEDPYSSGALNYGVVGGQLILDASLSAYSGTTGGSLTLVAPLIQIGGATLKNGDTGLAANGASISGDGTTLWLDQTGSSDFFSQGGFGSFTLKGLGVAPSGNPYASQPGVIIAANGGAPTIIDPVEENYEAIVDGGTVNLELTTYPLTSERKPVNLTFDATGVSATAFSPAVLISRGDLVMDAGVVIETDPLGDVSLEGQTVAVLGQVYAPGGQITVSGAGNSVNLFSSNQTGQVKASDVLPTVDLGSGSVLSTAGTTETTSNALGYDTGNVLNGGTISVSGNIVAEAGSLLDVSGTGAVLDVTPEAAGETATALDANELVPMLEDSNGGTITFKAGQMLFLDSTMLGAAGTLAAGVESQAQGGTLVIEGGFSGYNVTNPSVEAIQSDIDANLIVTADGSNVASSNPSGAAVIGHVVSPSDAVEDVDGDAVLDYFTASSNLFISADANSAVGNNGGKAGGFGSLELIGVVQFIGSVSIATSSSLIIGPSVAPSSQSTDVTTAIYADSPVVLSAPYVELGLPFGGAGSITNPATPVSGAGSLTVDSSELVDVGDLSLEDIDNLTINAAGDVRGDGTLNVAGDISITAAQLYPTTDTTFAITAFDPSSGSGSVTISTPAGGALPPLPLSAGGTLDIYAATITQGGVLRAPMGTINLGSLSSSDGLPVSNTVTLLAGSIVSVSAVDPTTGQGISIPYGSVDSNGDWIDPAGDTITAGSTPTLPAKAVNIAAATVNDVSGSTIDVRGGGDLYAAEFVTGTAGTKDILNSTTSFAVLPASLYSAGYAPSDSSDAGYETSSYGSNLKVGEQVYLSASSGLPAGTYTLLPARYALLPGAFLVTPESGSPGPATVEPDGSSMVSGYLVSSLNSTREQSLDTSFDVASQAVIGSRAEYSILSADTYFPSSATSLNVAVPRLPVDAGLVTLDATASLTLPNTVGTLLGQSGDGGLGSLVDITTPSDINIYNSSNPATPAINGDLNLDASTLDAFGADTLIIGGFTSVTSAGTEVAVSTSNLTVNNAGAPLVGPDIVLVSNGALTIAPDADIESSGDSSITAPVVLINGSGTALRVSSDPTAALVRSGFTPNTSGPVLTVGPDAFIGSTQGTGSVILDSTAAASLDPAALLSGNSVSINSGQISLVLADLASPLTTTPSGLVLSSSALSNLESEAQNLSLLSYSSIDIYGSGSIGGGLDASGQYPVQSLALEAAQIRGADNGGGAVSINADTVMLGDSPNGTALGSLGGNATPGQLNINAVMINLGVNPLQIDQYNQVTMTASSAIVAGNGTGSLTTSGNLTLSTPLLTAAAIVPLTPAQELAGESPATATVQTIAAGGNLILINPGGTAPVLAEGLGANVTLEGASVTADSTVQLPSGTLSVVAARGDLSVGGTLDVGGTQQSIYNATDFTNGGQINLSSYTGSVMLTGTLDLSAQAGGGDAGTLAISAPSGTFSFEGGSLLAGGGLDGQGGTFSLDIGSLGGTSLAALQAELNPVVSGLVAGDTYLGGFTESQTIRLRDGDITVDGVSAADSFNLSTDTGSITVVSGGEIVSNSGQVDADGNATASIDVTMANTGGGTPALVNPGVLGGSVNLDSQASVTLEQGAVITVAARTIDDAGQGGTVTLEAGDEIDGSEPSTSDSRNSSGEFPSTPGSAVAVIDIQSGSTIDLSVGVDGQVGTVTQDFDGSTITGTTGTLHLRAPQTQNNTDVQIDPINGNVVGASSIAVEGNEVYDLTGSGGAITSAVEVKVKANGNLFVGNAGTTTSTYTAMVNAIFGNNTALEPVALIEPGAEIVDTAGNLTLASSWDLSTYRFGPDDSAGDLTMRASGSIVLDFGASLSDGFTTNPAFASDGLWADILMPAGSQSWSYRLVAGADLSAADYQQVLPLSQSDALYPAAPDALAPDTGELELGLNAPALTATSSLSAPTTLAIMIGSHGSTGYYETIRTGIGSIDIVTGGDVQLLNNVATIYTAGTQSAALAGFEIPNLLDPRTAENKSYNFPAIGGVIATAQYSQDGGNVTISAQGNIGHYAPYDPSVGLPIVAYDINGNPLMEDSSLELPTDWLLRRGYSLNGVFGTDANSQVASTTWWVDFNNFYEGIGALGGGNVTLTAGGSIENVDAVVPTNARIAGQDASGDLITPTAGSLVESGGGDLIVQAGDDIDGGVYYVERGNATVDAGVDILTNDTRNVAVGVPASAETDLPTTFFLGKGTINVSAGDDLLLGPVVNPFLLPQNINNTINDKSYFSTYAASDSVTISSLTGTVTVDDAPPTGSLLLDFYLNEVSAGAPTDYASSYPWLGLVESDPTPFGEQYALMPPTLKAVAFSGDIDLDGSLTLSPSPVGTIDLVAAGSVNAFQPVADNFGVISWASAQIDLSDANPNAIPGVVDPLSYVANAQEQTTLADTNETLFSAFDNLFNVSGSTDGLYAQLTTQEALHADLPVDPSNPESALGPLHANDPNPIEIYAGTGDIDGLELFSGKSVDVIAGGNITNIGFYIQNVNPTDISLIQAGGDIIAYDENSSLREEVHADGGIFLNENDDDSNPQSFAPQGLGIGGPNAGDIQVSGPGTVEVLAGRNLDLGDGPNNSDGTGLGITSIGNTVNPFLPFGGASIIAAAGLGNSSSFDTSKLDFGNISLSNGSVVADDPAGYSSSFIGEFLDPDQGESAVYLPDLGSLMNLPTSDSSQQIWTAFSQQSTQQQDTLALTVFYDVLRDAGRDHNNPGSPNVGTYTEGYAAISALFPDSISSGGDISLTSREIKTTNGGDISLLAPGGQVSVGLNLTSAQAIDQGILTEDGGNISIFAQDNINVGTSRIFTLHGGNIIIWSSLGSIDAGSSSKTVQSAPPTRVLVDPESGNVETDLAGLATGGGIGVLATVAGAPPGDVDLIAPVGTVDAGDAGIRASGNLNIAAAEVLNAGNIQAGGSSTGVPTSSAPNISANVAASTTAGSASNSADQIARQQQSIPTGQEDMPSIISVQVISYGDDSGDNAETTPVSKDGSVAVTQ
jgi:filamentous hemagglutinin